MENFILMVLLLVTHSLQFVHCLLCSTCLGHNSLTWARTHLLLLLFPQKTQHSQSTVDRKSMWLYSNAALSFHPLEAKRLWHVASIRFEEKNLRKEKSHIFVYICVDIKQVPLGSTSSNPVSLQGLLGFVCGAEDAILWRWISLLWTPLEAWWVCIQRK